MLKRKLIKENLALFERLDLANAEIASQKDEIERLKNEIATLKEELITASKTKIETLAQQAKDEPTKAEPTEPEQEMDAISYGSSVIGKIVLAATVCSNDISAKGATAENKELINLILGRTEVAKSEVLTIVLSEKDMAEKRLEIDKIYSDACEYFNSVMLQ